MVSVDEMGVWRDCGVDICAGFCAHSGIAACDEVLEVRAFLCWKASEVHVICDMHLLTSCPRALHIRYISNEAVADRVALFASRMAVDINDRALGQEIGFGAVCRPTSVPYRQRTTSKSLF